MSSKKTYSEPAPYGKSVGQMIDQLSTLPGIGRKSAERITNYLLACEDKQAFELADAIREMKLKIKPCSVCFNLTDGQLCEICTNPRRRQDLLCIVEQPKDIVVLEKTGIFEGRYHVLQGRISPLEGIGPEDLTIGPLVKRIRNESITEIVMATNPTLEGDGTALYISNLLANDSIKITRLARGIASGSVLEFANKEMLADALRERQSL